MTVADQELFNTAHLYKAELMGRMFGFSAQSAPEATIDAEVEAAPDATENPASDGMIALLNSIPLGNNIVGMGFGAKVTAGSITQEDLSLRVYVRAKLPRFSLPSAEMVPPEINGMPTDVVAVGDITTLVQPPISTVRPPVRTAVRPVPCGVSVGHFQVSAGTLGCLVRPLNQPDANPYILSNNHVIANSNNARLGDPILQPGRADGGTQNDAIAELSDFEPVRSGGANLIDGAIARVFNPSDVQPEIIQIGRVQNPPIETASLYQAVRKRGRTTLQTVGVIIDLSADIRVQFGPNNIAVFVNQLGIVGAGGLFSSGGDSGSLIVDALTRQPIGLLFAGGRELTFANPIVPVLNRFQVEIL